MREIKRIAEECSGIKWNLGGLKTNFIPVNRRNNTNGVKAVCSNNKTISNIGDKFNIGSLIKWIKEGI